MPKFKVSTEFGGKDGLSRVFRRMDKAAGKFGKSAGKSFGRATKSALRFQNITKGILAAGAISRGVGLIGRGASAAATGFLDFDQAITSASAKFSDLNLSTIKGRETLLELRKTARQVGRDTEFSADQAASGLDFLALASFDSKQAMALLPGVTNLATVANVDLATATDIASDSLGAFGLATKDSEQLSINFNRVQDVMAKTTATSNTNLIDLFESVKKGAPAFTAAGQSIFTFNTLAGKMANAGVKGAESGTQLRNVMLRLAKPTKEAQQVLDKLGIETQDSKGNFLDVIDVLADFEKGLEGMGTKQKSAALATVFGARSVTGINILLKEGTEELRTYRKSLIDSTKAAEQMAIIMRSSLTNRLKSLGSALLDVGFQFFEAFAGKGANAIDTLTKFVRKIDLTEFISTIKIALEELSPVFSALGSAFKLLGSAFFLMWKIAKPILKALKIVIVPLVDAADKLFNVLSGIIDKIPEIPGFAVEIGGKISDTISGAATGLFEDISGSLKATSGLIRKLSGGEPEKPQLAPPNKAEAQSRAFLQVGLETTVNGPEGTTSETKMRRPKPINRAALGLNAVAVGL